MHTQVYTVSIGTCLNGAYPIVSVCACVYTWIRIVYMAPSSRSINVVFIAFYYSSQANHAVWAAPLHEHWRQWAHRAIRRHVSSPILSLSPPPSNKHTQNGISWNTNTECLKYIYAQIQMHTHTLHLQIQMQLSNQVTLCAQKRVNLQPSETLLRTLLPSLAPIAPVLPNKKKIYPSSTPSKYMLHHAGTLGNPLSHNVKSVKSVRYQESK